MVCKVCLRAEGGGELFSPVGRGVLLYAWSGRSEPVGWTLALCSGSGLCRAWPNVASCNMRPELIVMLDWARVTDRAAQP